MRATTCNQGLSIDFGFMVQKSRDSVRHNTLVGLNGETCYVLLTDHFSGRIFGRAFATKAPPIDWINSWLASNSPQCPDKYVRMDGGGELGKCRDIHRTFANFGYAVELTGPDSSHQNGPGERPHQTIGDALRTMLSGANLQPNFWPYAFYHYIRLYNFVPHGDRPTSPYEMWCPSPKSGKATDLWMSDPRSSNDCSIRSTVKTATHARFDEGMNDLDEPPPNVKLLRNLADDGVVGPDRLDLPAFNLEVSDDPFERLDELSPSITCEHPCLGFEIMECHIRRRGLCHPVLLPKPNLPDGGIACNEDSTIDDDHVQLLLLPLNTTTHGTPEEQSLGSFTRRKLRRLPNWKEWQDAEFKQLDSMAKQEMYGAPVPAPRDAIVLRQHWNYAIKGDGSRKETAAMDPRAAPQLKLANTYSSCIEQPCMRLFFALCAHEGYVSLKVDATNAYANSPPPNQPTFVVIDDQYADWYLARHVSIKELTRDRMLICRQVDDMAIGCVNVDAIKDLVRVICAEDGIDLRDEGILNSFNGVDVDQRDRYIKITCETYIDKLLAHYGWSSSGSRETDEKPIEPLAASTTQQMFDDYANAPRDGTAEYYDLETAAGFSYRSVLGALIYAYVVARPDIGYAVTTLARFSDHPAKVHYDALRRVARYLRMTKNWGLFYWRNVLLSSLPPGDFKILIPTRPS
ncbi:Reverse transcriptase (RNA-dependent DNA polymerase) [Fragilaria crotonensis]|nr:Reverse transcriptase (RNA-dependent DNA polymerase) [Fragilaria crotonensis]